MSGLVELSHVVGGDHGGFAPVPALWYGGLLDRLVAMAGTGVPETGTRESPGAAGTRLHAPRDATRGGANLATLPLGAMAGLPGVTVTVRPGPRQVITQVDLGRPEDLSGAVLLQTGWDARWGTASYLEPGPYLSRGAADLLVRAGATVVGTDLWSLDDTTAAERPVHDRLLGAGIPLVEGLANLSALPRAGFRFYAVPLRIFGATSMPVRAFAEVDRRSLPM